MAFSLGFRTSNFSSETNYDTVMRDASPLKRQRELEGDDLMSEESPTKKMKTPSSSAEVSPSKFWMDSDLDKKELKKPDSRRKLIFALDEVAVDDSVLMEARDEVAAEIEDLFHLAVTPLAFSSDHGKIANCKKKFLEKRFRDGVCFLRHLSEPAALEVLRSIVDSKIRSSVKYILAVACGLETALRERKKLSFHERLTIAAFVEERFSIAIEPPNREYVSKTESGTSRALIIDHQKRQFLVLSKENSFLCVKGAERKVSNATLICKNDKKITGKSFAHLVNIDEEDVKDMIKQAELADTIYQDVFLTVSHTTKTGKEKVSVIVEESECNLEQARKKIAKDSTAIFSIMKQVADTVAFLHNNCLVHGDIKGANIVLTGLDSDAIKAKLVDFGATYDIDGEWPRKVDSDAPVRGYATAPYSSPESYGAVTRLEDELEQGKAEDMYALGCVLYSMLFPEETTVSWGPEVDKAVVRASDSMATRLAVQKQQKGLDDIKKKAHAESDGQRKLLLEICVRLLEMDPKKRMIIEILQSDL